MAFKDRFRRAISRSQTTTRSNSWASSNPTISPVSPTATPALTLTKASTRLSKRLTWSRTPKEEKKEREVWDEEKAVKGLSGKHQDILKGFEWKWRSSLDRGANSNADADGDGDRRRSWMSAVSPRQSRVGSLDDGYNVAGRRKSSGVSAVHAHGLERVKSGGKDVDTIEE